MPRTSRRTATTGLAWEAVAPLLRWLLHSPRRLAALVAVVVAVGWLITSHATSTGVEPAAIGLTSSTGPAPPAATVPPSAPWTPTASTSATSTAAVGLARPGEVAVRFVTVWAHPERSVEAWRTEVSALATPEFGAQLRTVLPVNVPAHQVTGDPVMVSATELTAAVTVPTEAGPVLVDLALLGNTWKVSSLTPAEPPSRTEGAGSSLAATYTPLPAGR